MLWTTTSKYNQQQTVRIDLNRNIAVKTLPDTGANNPGSSLRFPNRKDDSKYELLMSIRFSDLQLTFELNKNDATRLHYTYNIQNPSLETQDASSKM